MALPPSGAISISQIVTEFGGPGNLGSYYRGGTYIANNGANLGIPTSGAISLSNFYNAFKVYNATTAYFDWGAGATTGSIVRVQPTSHTTTLGTNGTITISYVPGVFTNGRVAHNAWLYAFLDLQYASAASYGWTAAYYWGATLLGTVTNVGSYNGGARHTENSYVPYSGTTTSWDGSTSFSCVITNTGPGNATIWSGTSQAQMTNVSYFF
jgi:hypothetical protein